MIKRVGRAVIIKEDESPLERILLDHFSYLIDVAWGDVIRGNACGRSDNERVINEALRESLQRKIKGEEEFRSRYLVARETEWLSDNDSEVPEGRIDIPVYVLSRVVNEGEQAPQLLIEAKRVEGSSGNLARLYVNEGIKRFKTGKYAGNHNLAFMVGYVVRGKRLDAATGINGELRAQIGNEECIDLHQNFGPGFSGLCDRGNSQHERPSLESILLYHFFLGFS